MLSMLQTACKLDYAVIRAAEFVGKGDNADHLFTFTSARKRMSVLIFNRYMVRFVYTAPPALPVLFTAVHITSYTIYPEGTMLLWSLRVPVLW